MHVWDFRVHFVPQRPSCIRTSLIGRRNIDVQHCSSKCQLVCAGGEDHLRLLLKLTKSVMRKEARSGASLGRGIDLLLPRPDNASAQPSGDTSEQDGQAADAGRSSEDDAQDVSQSLLSGIQSMKARPEKQRVPLNLLRTEKDR